MSVLQKLYDDAEDEGVVIDNYKLGGKLAFSYLGKKNCSIAVDYSLVDSNRLEKQIIAEELTHCTKGYFYEISNINNPLHKQNIQNCWEAKDNYQQKLVAVIII